MRLAFHAHLNMWGLNAFVDNMRKTVGRPDADVLRAAARRGEEEGFVMKLKGFLGEKGIRYEHFVFKEPCHTVEEAARAVGGRAEDFVKSICLTDASGVLIVAVVGGGDRVSRQKVGNAIGTRRPRMATAQEILERTGYPLGGVPPFGYDALFVIDAKVAGREAVYGGGGTENSLVKVAPAELQRANGGMIADITE
jgi:prolyl-tRNA editing enzyme YbaK/EbsC (Cys-tRNA(Pro) deacylase)